MSKIFNTRQEMIKNLNLYGRFAEIGVLNGNFSQDILDICPYIHDINLVDIWSSGNIISGDQDGNNVVTYEGEQLYKIVCDKFKDNPRIKIIKALSNDYLLSLPDNHLNGIYIDADHSYEGCIKDLRLALRKVKKNGWILGHDYDITDKCKHRYNFGVKKAVDEICKEFGLTINAYAMDGCVSYAIKNNPKPLNIAICSLSDRPDLCNISWKVLSDYCENHNYEFYISSKIIDKSRHPSWSKILLIDEVLNRQHDMIVWIDDDIIITEPQISLEKLLADFIYSDKIFCTSSDTNGQTFNCGFMAVKNMPQTKELLIKIYRSCDNDGYKGFWEQTTMQKLYNEDEGFKSTMYIYPPAVIQGFYSNTIYKDDKFLWKNGKTFACHLAGLVGSDRVQIMKYLSQKYSKEILDLLLK